MSKPLGDSKQPPRPLVAIIGDYNPANTTHRLTDSAFSSMSHDLTFEWLATDAIVPDRLERLSQYSGFLIAPSSPYRSMAGALSVIRFAREQGIPLLGT